MSLFGVSGPYAGVPIPKILAGKMILPPHCSYNNATLSATSGRYYAVPFPVAQATAYAGAKFYNSGTGDNGNKVKVAIYSEASGGGLGALAHNFGEATLTASAAIRSLASSWTAAPGMYYLVIVANAAVAFGGMDAMVRDSAVGYHAPNQIAALNSLFPADVLGVAISSTAYVGDYVAGTYANFPESTGLALTNSLLSIAAQGSSGSACPLVGLYT